MDIPRHWGAGSYALRFLQRLALLHLIICGGTRFVTYVDAGAKKCVCAGGGGDCDCLIVCVANLMETKKSNHAWARTCSKKGSTCSKKCFAAMFELKFFRPLLRPDPQGGMLCPYCGEVRYSKEWRPCQVREQKHAVGNYDGCRICDHLPATTQRRLVEKVGWRYWYLMEPPAQAALENFGAPGPSGTPNDEGAAAPFFSHQPKSGWSWGKDCVQALQSPFRALRGGSWDSKEKKGSRPTGGHHGDGAEPKSLPVETAEGVHGHGALLGGLQGDYSTGVHSSTSFWHEMAGLSFVIALSERDKRHFLAKLRTGKAQDDLSWRWQKRLGGQRQLCLLENDLLHICLENQSVFSLSWANIIVFCISIRQAAFFQKGDMLESQRAGVITG